MSDFRIDHDFLLECAQALIRAPSENPPGDETAVAQVCADFAAKAGCSVERIHTGPNRLNVIATLDSGNPGKTMLWNGHIDVVPAGDPSLWTHPPYEAVVENGVLYGRGSADMKGPIAAVLAAAKALSLKSGRLVIQMVADEEVLGPYGTNALYDQGLIQADAAIVGEPTELKIAIAERGMVWIRVRTQGVAAHGSRPDTGVSAIEKMAPIVSALRQMQWNDPHPLLGLPTLNIGTIAGGDKINIVPPWCEILIDRRTLPGETHEAIIKEVEALSGDADVEIFHSAEPCEIPAGDPLVVLAQDVLRSIGREPAIDVMTGTTDAHLILGKAKIPTIILGPGSLSVAHAANEHVGLSELQAGAETYESLIRQFLRAEVTEGHP